MSKNDHEGLFKVGHPGYKQKGTLNKKTREFREKIDMVLNFLDDRIEQNLESLSPKEQVQMWMDLQEFIRPKLQRTQTDLTTKGDAITKITFEVKNGSTGRCK